MFRMFILLIGFSLSVAGGVSLIAFLNLISAGHGFVKYLLFISTRSEFYIFLIGLAFIWGSIYIPSFRRNSDQD
ncbi:hypothetical protein MOJ78_08490 [Alkalihalobacillus sp. AL-G]|nr:hypothetical protein [Alkalihalobacillus sp. AL-G]WLD95368.1 hypothetical protein MOJ78_08490 [Alkalihalobacillus sp. AL-G]